MKDCSSCIHYDNDADCCELDNVEFQDFGKGCGDWEDEEDEDCGYSNEELGFGQDEPNY